MRTPHSNSRSVSAASRRAGPGLAFSSGNRQRGAALLAALCFATVLAVSLGSYITVCYRTLEMSSRGVHGLRSVELAELGMEEGLWALNNSTWTGWTIVGTTASRTLTGFTYDNGATGSASITITNYNGLSGTRTVTVTGITQLANGTQISRSLTATSAEAPLFTNAVAGTSGTVKFTAANNTSVFDSYDSTLGTYASQPAGYSAIVSSGSTATSSATVQLTNAQVKGYVATLSTGPSYSTSATLKGPSTPVTTRVDTTRMSTSPYQPVFDIRTISGAGTTLANPAAGAVTTIGTAGATSASIYYSTEINMVGSATKLIVNGPVKLVVSGPFYVGRNGGNPQIEITSNGTLEVFVQGDIAIHGRGISNLTQLPKRCAIYGTNTLTVPEMDTSTDFHGVIYTPSGDFKVASNNRIFGAIIARNVVFSGNSPKVHYDVALRSAVFAGIDTPFAVSDWRETTTGN